MHRGTLALLITLPLTACAMPEPTPAAQQVAAQPETPEQRHERQCKALAWAQYANGPSTGNFGADMNASLARVNDTLQRCRMNMPPAAPAPQPVVVQQQPATPRHVMCQPMTVNSRNPDYYCTRY